MNPLAQAEVCREQLPWAKPFIRETYRPVLHCKPGAEWGRLHHRRTGSCWHAVQFWEKPKAPWRCGPGGSASQRAGPSSNSSKGGLSRLAPWPSWPSAASARKRHKPPSEPASVQAKGRSLAPYRAGKTLQRPALTLCYSCREGCGLSAACHVYCPGGMFTSFEKERRRERESCSIVLLKVEKGWTNSNQTQNRNSSQAETFFCQVSALGEFSQLSNKLLKQRLRGLTSSRLLIQGAAQRDGHSLSCRNVSGWREAGGTGEGGG